MVQFGADRTAEFAHFFTGRVALLTGPSGRTRSNQSTIQVLKDCCDLQLLLAPEHGVRGELQPGQAAEDFVDPRTGIKCVSLFSGGFGGVYIGFGWGKCFRWQIDEQRIYSTICHICFGLL